MGWKIEENHIEYIYDAAGNKLSKIIADKKATPIKTTDYVGGFIYSNQKLESMFTAEGRLQVGQEGQTFTREYYLKDHLGNNRIVFAVTDDKPEVLQESNYYPFGMTFDTWDKTLGDDKNNKYLYNGKELQNDPDHADLNLDMLDYGARFYDPVIGRFSGIDPLAELYYSTSPYVYCGNNPVLMVDPTGMSFWSSNYLNENVGHWTDRYNNEEGQKKQGAEEKKQFINDFVKLGLSSDNGSYSYYSNEEDAYAQMRKLSYDGKEWSNEVSGLLFQSGVIILPSLYALSTNISLKYYLNPPQEGNKLYYKGTFKNNSENIFVNKFTGTHRVIGIVHTHPRDGGMSINPMTGQGDLMASGTYKVPIFALGKTIVDYGIRHNEIDWYTRNPQTHTYSKYGMGDFWRHIKVQNSGIDSYKIGVSLIKIANKILEKTYR